MLIFAMTLCDPTPCRATRELHHHRLQLLSTLPRLFVALLLCLLDEPPQDLLLARQVVFHTTALLAVRFASIALMSSAVYRSSPPRGCSPPRRASRSRGAIAAVLRARLTPIVVLLLAHLAVRDVGDLKRALARPELQDQPPVRRLPAPRHVLVLLELVVVVPPLSHGAHRRQAYFNGAGRGSMSMPMPILTKHPGARSWTNGSTIQRSRVSRLRTILRIWSSEAGTRSPPSSSESSSKASDPYPPRPRPRRHARRFSRVGRMPSRSSSSRSSSSTRRRPSPRRVVVVGGVAAGPRLGFLASDLRECLGGFRLAPRLLAHGNAGLTCRPATAAASASACGLLAAGLSLLLLACHLDDALAVLDLSRARRGDGRTRGSPRARRVMLLQLRAIGVVAHQIVAIPVAVRVVRVLAVVIVVAVILKSRSVRGGGSARALSAERREGVRRVAR